MSFINLLVLRCAKLEASRSFYECFGLNFEPHRHGNGPEHLFNMDSAGLIIELYPATEKHPADRCGIGMGTPDLLKTRGKLLAAGFEPAEPKQEPWGMTFVVRDPDGRRVEVIERMCEGDEEFADDLRKRIEESEHEEGIPAEEVFKELRESIKNFKPSTKDRWAND